MRHAITPEDKRLSDFHVVIPRTGCVILSTSNHAKAVAAAIFREVYFGPLEVHEIIRSEVRNVQAFGSRGLPMGSDDLAIPQSL